jgi:hypothetical protein
MINYGDFGSEKATFRSYLFTVRFSIQWHYQSGCEESNEQGFAFGVKNGKISMKKKRKEKRVRHL